jgi:hypothetical protein
MSSWYSISATGKLVFPAPSEAVTSETKAPRASRSTSSGAGPHAAAQLAMATTVSEARCESGPSPKQAAQTPWYRLDSRGSLSFPGSVSPRSEKTKPRTDARALRRRARLANAATLHRQACADPFKEAFAAVQREMRQSRGRTGERQREHVRVIMASMSLEQQQQAARERAQVARLSFHRVSAISQYTAYCMEMGKPGAVFPIDCNAVAGYLTWKVFKAGKQRASSHTLANHLSNLKVAAEELDQWKLDGKDAATIKAMIRQLQETCPSQPQRSESIPLVYLISACARLRRAGTLQAMQSRALLAVSAGALTRGREVGGEEGMRWQDLVVDERGLAFQAHFCKVGKQSLAARVRVCPHMPRTLEEICPARCLMDFKEAWIAAGGTAAPDDLVWCAIKGTQPSRVPLPCVAAQRMIEAEFKKEGVASRVGAHWGRHAGRHLLVHELGLGSHGADLAGDWQPSVKGATKESASRSSKSTGEKHYAHSSVDDVWNEVTPFIPSSHRPRCCRRSQ